MNIFIDLDDTLYNTSSALQGSAVAFLLIAEATAPLFDYAKEAIDNFNKKGATCWAVTARGLISDEEVDISKQRLQHDFCKKGEPQKILGIINNCETKMNAIKMVWNNYYNTEIKGNESILIENDFEQVIDAKQHGVHAILFSSEALDEESKNACKKLQIPVAQSWKEVEKIVNRIWKENDKDIKSQNDTERE